MKQVNGWWVTDGMTGAGKYVRAADALVQGVLALDRPYRRTAIQAGGHVGCVPIKLAEHYRRVYTCEPHPHTFECLVENVVAHNMVGITASRCALGQTAGEARLVLGKHASTSHIGDVGEGVPVNSIDALGLQEVDLICLDLEGYEITALRGAWETIGNWWPVLVVEWCKYAGRYGHAPGALEKLMKQLRYERFGVVGVDEIWVPK